MSTSDWTGRRFGMLLVVGLAPSKKYGNQSHRAWTCVCDCGTTHVVTGANLSKSTRSCGCSRGASIRKSKQKPAGYNGLTIVFNEYRASARTRGLAFQLSREDVGTLTSQNCFYCNARPIIGAGRTHRSTAAALHAQYAHNGMDRVDPACGYLLSNVVPCCRKCNMAKFTMTQADFLAHIESIYLHQSSKKAQ